MLKKYFPAYHAISKLYLYLNKHNQIYEVPVEICTNMLAFSFGPKGWHYFVEVLKEYDKNPAINYRDTTLYRFYKAYQHEDLFSLMYGPDETGKNVKFRPPLGIYPWGSFKAKSQYNGGIVKNYFTSHLCGPSENFIIEQNFNNLLELYNILKTEGYQPWGHHNSFIGGTFLIKKNGEKRFVVVDGSHRLAVLNHLGVKKVLVRLLPQAFKVIRESEVSDWYYVKNGKCSEQDALYYFDLFFKSDGNERVSALGL